MMRAALWSSVCGIVAAGLAAPASGGECVTAAAGSGWHRASFPTPQDIFTADFDATPSAAPLNAVVGLAELAPTAYTSLSAIARFNPEGRIDARNGAAYEARNAVRYSAGVRYHFRMTVDVAGERYSLYVAPRGGREVAIARDFEFRGDGGEVFTLEHWGAFTAGSRGRLDVCNFEISVGAVDDATPPGAMVTASTHDGNVPANTVDNDFDTRWSGDGDGAWIQYELSHDRNHVVAYVRIGVYRGDRRQNRFDLQVSHDGVTWTDVITNGVTSGTSTAEELHDFPDVFANYVRYVGHGSTVGTFNSLTELTIYTVSSVGGTPTPTRPPRP